MLPVLNTMKYEITLPLSKKTINIRPWLVGEEKALLIAKESEKPDVIANAVVNVLKECSFGEDIESMPMVDVEYILLMAKSYSNGEMSTVAIRCNNDLEAGGKCGHISEVEIDLQKETELTVAEPIESNIKLTETIGVVMHPPMFNSFRAMLKEKTLAEISFETIASAVDYVYINDEIIRDFTPEEVSVWFNSFSEDQLEKITDYLGSIPKLKVSHEYVCPNCKYEGTFTVENLFNFFIG